MLPLEVSCAMTTGVPEARINKMVSVRCCRKAPREKFMILQVVRRVKRPTLAAAGAASRDSKRRVCVRLHDFRATWASRFALVPEAKLLNRRNREISLEFW